MKVIIERIGEHGVDWIHLTRYMDQRCNLVNCNELAIRNVSTMPEANCNFRTRP